MPQSNIKQAYAMLDGKKVVASYSDETGLWTVETTAPAESSWSKPGHVYLMSLHAEDLAGNTCEVTSEDPIYGSQLKIRVLEKTKPTALIKYPTSNSVIGKSFLTAQLQVSDAGGSGLNMDSVEFFVNSDKVTSLTWSGEGSQTAEYEVTGLSDGNNTFTLQVTDNDGNVSDLYTVTFIVSTEAPSLDVTSPPEGLYTNDSTITVSGTAGTGKYADIQGVTVNGEAATVDDDGSWTYDAKLQEGENELTIVVKDSAGNTTTVHRTVHLDTKAPIITDVKAEAVTVDAGSMIRVTFKISESGAT